MAPIKVDKEEKRKIILQAAIDIFSQKGFHKATVAEIAKKACVAKGSIYDYFKSKDELIASLMEYIFAQTYEDMQTSSLSNEDPVAQLKEIFLKATKAHEKWEEIAKLFIYYWGESLNSPKAQIIREIQLKSYIPFSELVIGIYQKGVQNNVFRQLNPTHVFLSYLSLIDYVATFVYLMGDRQYISLEEFGKTAFDIFLRGILKERAQQVGSE